MHKRSMLLALASLFAATVIFATPTAAAAQNRCPSGGTPVPGSKVNGGLEVDGTCILKSVTINGGVTVDSTGHLSQQGGAVHGGITVKPGRELDVNATTNGGGAPTHTTSTIDGGINFNGGSGHPSSDADIWTARINGGISFTGTFPLSGSSFNRPFLCGNHINGAVKFFDVTAYGGLIFGDPDAGCPGNTIKGSLSVTNSNTTISRIEVESNTISGSASLRGSTLDFSGNTVGGSLSCKNGTVLLAPDAGDTSSNMVRGSNTC